VTERKPIDKPWDGRPVASDVCFREVFANRVQMEMTALIVLSDRVPDRGVIEVA
jgi:hypothetical protein